MKIPEKIKIGGIDYKIRLVEGDGKELDAGGCIGKLDNFECKIYIADNIDKQRQVEVLIHEVVHGILDYIGFSEELHSEDNVEKIGRVLFQVLRDNDMNFG